ncbi:MAG TPA: 50S ribosomal protein L35 [Gaiellaceae bacterium]|nr:50S ribosomal protein L35 [Gaiellaceae bacterium]
MLRRPTMRAHKLEKKSSKRKRGFRRVLGVTGADVKEVKKMLGVR